MSDPLEPEASDASEVPITMDQSMAGGCWANFAVIRHSVHEFTVDFIRLEYAGTETPVEGTVVQRINMSPLFVSQFIEALQQNWEKYAEKSMPPEVGIS